MQNKFKKNFITVGLSILTIIILTFSYFWFNCKNGCFSLLISKHSSIIEIFFNYLKKILTILILFIIFKIIQNVFVNKIFKKIMHKLGSNKRYESIIKIINFGLWTLFVFIAISTFIGNITVFLASFGLVGFGLTFALQKPILNFVGWLTIILKDIYHEGDRIKINNVIGDVKEIQIMNTIVQGLLESSDVLSGKTISFPNELILTTDVQNYTKDSNYIVNELSISITYESDYKQAMKILNQIIYKQVSKNKEKYLKIITKQNMKLDKMVSRWINSHKKINKNDNEEQLEIKKIKDQKEHIESDIKALEEEFIPLIRVEMLDSSIQLIAQFKSPYNEIKKNRTEINLAFLDAIKDYNDIEIAYPHLQLIK